ncbi:C-type lectin domain family 4 member F-like isoform X1 [Acipenser ruthenus]|uniref:C-type lectin domain family 4 member F-like isoform X1 n=1 Tax=Acipenser ruthenus TaxID=7906 RepID=UPI0027403930|nr:C-type lectin domain family 4 member F-like isoform X1 [Acipenser ruthenus]
MEMDSYESDQVYENVDIKQPPSRRAGKQHGESAAPVDSSDRQAAYCGWDVWLLIALSCLLLAGSVALGVLFYNLQTKNLKLQSQYSELERNYTDISVTVSDFQTKNLELQSQYSELERNYTDISATVSDFQTKNLELQSRYSELERNYTDISARVCEACPQNWELFNGKCHYFSTDRMNWHSSRDNCTSLGGHLVIIESEAEQRFLSEKVWNITHEAKISNEEEQSHWIGLTDSVTEGTWLWVDGTPLNEKAKFWATRTHDKGKEPDDYNGEDPAGEDCAQLQPKRNSKETWFDSSCKKQYKRICETKAVIA